MLVPCQECNHENQLGAIFCRNCGAKLNIEELSPKVKDKSSIGILKLIRRLIGIILLLILVGVFLGLFIPYGLKEYEPLPEEQHAQVAEKWKKLKRKLINNLGRNKEYSFTPQEMTYLYNNLLFKQADNKAKKKDKEQVEGEEAAEEDNAYSIDKLTFYVNDDGVTSFIMESQLAGKIPTRFELSGYLGNNPDEYVDEEETEESEEDNDDEAEDGVQFHVTSAKMGHITVPGFLQNKIIEKFEPLLEDEIVQIFLKKTKKVEVDENNDFAIYLK